MLKTFALTALAATLIAGPVLASDQMASPAAKPAAHATKTDNLAKKPAHHNKKNKDASKEKMKPEATAKTAP